MVVIKLFYGESLRYLNNQNTAHVGALNNLS